MQMASIKQLPRTVHSSLRSSVILFDLTRVVEELIYNSIDAGAAKVYVAINIGECYVKVEDDGCGITREGLVLVGEKYATSKLHSFTEMDATSENLGFRGEALGSLSDVSLLEVTTKARGRPNGYRKIIKGCKCLYLGIDDDRQELGTTVVVRDLFYNQPVRRKCMQCSPKKVLHSVKKCVLRVALVHPQVSFKVKDVESGEELLQTHPSCSSLPLVSSGFGLDVSHFHEMNFSKGIWKLSGYMSDPVDIFSMKAFQYVYINSRFVCKGPIHKLLNSLADSSNCSDIWKGASEFQNEKRSRLQATPAYILNLCCPRSNYDLTFEPSKTMVQFKDWVSVLSFIEEATRQFWRQMLAQGKPHDTVDEVSQGCAEWKKKDEVLLPSQDIFNEDLPMTPEILKKKYRMQCDENLLNTVASEEPDLLLHPKKRRRQSEALQQDVIDYFHQFSYTSQPISPTALNDFHLKTTPVACPENYLQTWPPCRDPLSVKDNMLCSEVTGRWTFEGDLNNDIFDSKQDNNFLEVDPTMNERSRESSISSCFDHKNNVGFPTRCPRDLRKPFLRSCSFRGKGSSPRNMLAIPHEFDSKNDDKGKLQTRQSASGDLITAVDADDSKQNFDISPETSLSKIFVRSTHCSNVLTNHLTTLDHNIQSTDFINYPPANGVCCTVESDFFNESADQSGKQGSDSLSTNAARKSVSSYSAFGSVGPGVDHSRDEYFMSCKNAKSNIFEDREVNYKCLSYANLQYSSNEEEPTSSCTNVDVDYEYEYPRRYLCGSPFLEGQSNDCSVQRFASHYRFTRGMEWLGMDSFVTDATNCFTPTRHITSPNRHEIVNPKEGLGFQYLGPSSSHKERSRRSHSAPPFYKGKSKFSTLYNCANITAENDPSSPNQKVTGGLNQSSQFSNVSQHHFEQSPVKIYPHNLRMPVMMMQYGTDQIKDDLTSNKLEGLELSEVKWRDRDQLAAIEHERDKSHSLSEQNDILDIFSGFLHLAGGSVVPESVSKDCLKDAKVLLQLDKKFIPVVAGTTLAVIDQHAADERIRLEELRHKVLSGEGKSVSHLESEQELALPEVGYQLLQNYAEEIQNWGWICNVHAQGSGSFRKNINLLHRRTSVITLLAVPCILGVNLSDKDLLEFLEQLAETDGSSTLPPSVIRVLNFKACRGAIMFGDALLPSECSLIIEELKQTSLCFQCAHGRPTTVPLVNLDALHKQIASQNKWNRSSDEPWHGLHHHTPSLERARQRLIRAGGQPE